MRLFDLTRRGVLAATAGAGALGVLGSAVPLRVALASGTLTLTQAGLSLEQLDLIELNEAFASQALYVTRQLGLDPGRVNVNGGAIALGHPLGCTGAKLTATLLHDPHFAHQPVNVGGRSGAALVSSAGAVGVAPAVTAVVGARK